MTIDGGKSIDTLAAEERRQFAHEHSKAYDALNAAAVALEALGPGHQREWGLLRAMRRRLASHLVDGGCDE